MNQTSSQPSAFQNKTCSLHNEFALYFQVLLFNVFQFQLNRNVFHRHDDEFFVGNLESSVD